MRLVVRAHPGAYILILKFVFEFIYLCQTRTPLRVLLFLSFLASSSSSSSDDDHLDEEDFELIEENTGRRIKPAKKFKRLQRRIRDDESSSDFEDEVVSAAKSHTAPLENMFDESEENFQKSRKSFQKLSSSRYSDEADFFEDEEEEEEDDIANFIEEDMDNEEDNTSRLDQKLNKLHKSSRSSVSKTQTIHSPSSSNAFSEYGFSNQFLVHGKK